MSKALDEFEAKFLNAFIVVAVIAIIGVIAFIFGKEFYNGAYGRGYEDAKEMCIELQRETIEQQRKIWELEK